MHAVGERRGAPTHALFSRVLLRKMLNINFCHYACSGNNQIACSTEIELLSMSKALESIICFMFFVILYDKSLSVC